MGSMHHSEAKSTLRRLSHGDKSMNALDLLMTDHKEVQKLFKEFKRQAKEKDAELERQLAQKICAELRIHAQIEEEIFYPAVRNAIDDKDIMDEAQVEHASAKELIAEIEAMQPTDDLFEARVTVLGEYINHHIEEEQDEMFPKVRKSDLDLDQLGQELAQRKSELQKEVPAETFAAPEKSAAGTRASRSRAAEPAHKTKHKSGYLRQHHGSRS